MSAQTKLQPVEGTELMAIEGGRGQYAGGDGGGFLGGVGSLLGGLGRGGVNIALNITNNIAVIVGNFLSGGSSIAVGQQGGPSVG
jgi:hypothetical protein